MERAVLLVVGPTAVGKTKIATRLAQHFSGEIVSADSRQIYRYMDIGTAKPTPEELAAAKHHFINIKHPDEYYSAGQYAREARACIERIFLHQRLPIVVGGSGLYIRALVDGLFEPRVSDANVKARLQQEVEKLGLSQMYRKLQSVDPQTADRLQETDRQRIVRALEVYEVTHQPFSSFIEKETPSAPFEPIFIGLTMDRTKLYERIEQRVDEMMASGLLEEVRKLRQLGYGADLNALKTVGYKEVNQFLDKKIDFEAMVGLIKQKTRNYAKRQLTWFRKDKRITWFSTDQPDFEDQLFEYVQTIFNKNKRLDPQE